MSHFSSNIPSTISSGSIFSELLRIVRYSQRTDDFIPRTYDLFSGMIAQGRNRVARTKQLQKAFHRYPNVFQKFGITHKERNITKMKNS